MTKSFFQLPQYSAREPLRNCRGQSSVEAILIMVIFTAFAMYATKQFKQRKTVSAMVSGPWEYVDGMAQHGVWGPQTRVKTLSPYISRRITTRAEPE